MLKNNDIDKGKERVNKNEFEKSKQCLQPSNYQSKRKYKIP